MLYQNLKKQFHEMTADELRQAIMDMRTRRRTPAEKPAKTAKRTAAPDLTALTEDQLREMLSILGGEDA